MKYKKLLIILLIALLVITPVLVYLSHPFVVFPTHSKAHTLKVVGKCVATTKTIRIKYTSDGGTVCHTLDFKRWVGVQETQTYALPVLEDGEAEVIADIKVYDHVYTLSVQYDNAKKLYSDGLLLYCEGNYVPGNEQHPNPGEEYYIYFISGRNKDVYFREAFSSKWVKIEDAPKPKKIEWAEIPGYILWKDKEHYAENKWETTASEE